MSPLALRTAQWRYCAKVGIAAALAYVLTLGGQNDYAIYGAFTAALIVGASVGEDLATSANRVKGTLVGMAAGMAVSTFFGPSALAVGLATALTALFALACGWGIAVARVGASLCIVTLVVHNASALEYDLLRAANTLIGIVVGLAVSFFAWPVRAHEEVRRARGLVLDASARLLDAMAAGGELRKGELALYEAVGAMVKAGLDGRRERRVRMEPSVADAAALQALQLGFEVLALALAADGHSPAQAPRASIEALRRRLDELARENPAGAEPGTV
jgi:uncharacterized membrane protein YccC